MGGFSGGAGGEYWMGQYYNNNPFGMHTGWQIYTSIQVPSSAPVDGDQYVVLLSSSDSNFYYDQVGLASDWGCPSGCGNFQDTWSVAWEQGTWTSQGCGWAGSHSRDGYDSPGLTPGAWYTFGMLLTGTKISFRLWSGQFTTANLLWQQNQSDTANFFYVQNQVLTCYGGPVGNSAIASMTLYEEVAYIYGGYYPQAFPRWDFVFNHTSYETGNNQITQIPASVYSGGGAGWGNFPGIPHNYETDTSWTPYAVRLANEAYMLNYSTDMITIAPGGPSATVYGNVIAVGDVPPYDYVVKYSTSWNVVCGWGGLQGSCSIGFPVPSGGNPFTVWAPAGTAPGYYYGGVALILINTAPNEADTFIFYIDVT